MCPPKSKNKVKENIQPIFRLLWREEDWQAGSLYNAGPSDGASRRASCLPVWVVPAQASRAGRDEPIVTVDAGSHVRPVGSAGVCHPPPGARRWTGCQALGAPWAGDGSGLRTGGLVLSFPALWGQVGGGEPLRRSEQASQAYRISTLPAATSGLGWC